MTFYLNDARIQSMSPDQRKLLATRRDVDADAASAARNVSSNASSSSNRVPIHSALSSRVRDLLTQAHRPNKPQIANAFKWRSSAATSVSV